MKGMDPVPSSIPSEEQMGALSTMDRISSYTPNIR